MIEPHPKVAAPILPGTPLTRTQSATVGRVRRGRNYAMLAALVLLALLFYALAFVKLSHH